MQRIGHAAFVLLLAVLGGEASAQADELRFKNGDRWSGTLVSLVDGTVRFKTELVGELTVAASEIQNLSTAEAVETHLKDGTVRHGLIAGTSVARFHAINPPEPAWSGRALLAAAFERGNTIKDSSRLEFNMGYESDVQRVALRATYKGERTENTSTGERTTQDRNLFGRARYEYLYTERDYWWLLTSGEKDGPSNLNLRFIAGSGLGRDFYRLPAFKLSAYAGPTFVSEHFKNDDDEQRAAGMLGWDLLWKLTASLSFFSEGTWTQAGKDDILIKSEAGLRDDVTAQIFLEGKILWQYQSEPAADAERQDVDYILGLGYAF